jgi:hypothetical protein
MALTVVCVENVFIGVRAGPIAADIWCDPPGMEAWKCRMTKLPEKLRLKGLAEEDIYFAKRDLELIDALRRRRLAADPRSARKEEGVAGEGGLADDDGDDPASS